MSIELKRKELELNRVLVAKQEMELKIAEKEEEIRRLQSHILIQNETIEKVTQEIKLMKESK